MPSLRSSSLRPQTALHFLTTTVNQMAHPPLSDKIDPKGMGSCVQRFAPKDVEKKKAGDATVGKDTLDKAVSA